MAILGISSATKIMSVGLVDDGRLLAETTVADLRAEKIMFYVKEAGITPDQIKGMVVAAGPGSYSGLRGGLAAAKALAQTLSVPLAGVSTLEAIAYNLVEVQGTMAVVLDAKAADYNFALFGVDKGVLRRLTDDLVLNLDKIVEKLSAVKGPIHLAGNLSKIRPRLKGDNFLFAEEAHGQPYGINVARLGELKIRAGQTEDILKLVPNYSHKPNIREYAA